MTEIEDLIRQAQESKRKWKLPKPEDTPPPRACSWQELLDNRGYDADRVAYNAKRPGWL